MARFFPASSVKTFWHTDVIVSGKLQVDGKVYPEIGVSFRGNNSLTSVPAGSKLSLSIKLDFVNDQNLLGYRELKLLNANQDPTFLVGEIAEKWLDWQRLGPLVDSQQK